MSDSGQAVFLSYASQDAEAAKRICDALRAAGVEVWFDQSELVGGDAWDQKIRKQIKDCALLIPIISKTTQGRREAYFRLEWKLADERTHLMAKGTPFLLPVTIDETSDRDALVPDSFLAVQWTKAPGGEAPAEFANRVKKVLGGESAAGRDRRVPPSAAQAGSGDPAPQRKSRSWLVPAILGAVVIAVATVWLARKPAPAPAPTASAAPPAPSGSNGQTEAQKLVAQAAQILESGDELNREIYFLAEDLVKRALTLEPANAPAAALAAEISYRMTWFGFDRTRARLTTLRQQAERALALAPQSVEARLAHAEALTALDENLPGALTATLQLAREVSGNWRVQRALAEVYRQLKQSDAALAAYQKSQQLSGGDPAAAANLVNYMLMLGRTAEAEMVVNETLPRRTGSRLIALDVILKTQWRGDTAAATATLAQWPDWLLREDRGAHLAWQAWYWQRQPDRALAAAQLATRDYLRDAYFNGPRAALTALAQEMAGHPEAAQADWKEVVELTSRELVTDSQDASALYWKAWALERLGDHAGARAIGALIQQRNLPATANIFRFRPIAPLWATLGQLDDAVADLQGRVAATDRYAVNRATLELDPALAPLRTDPRFVELVKRAPAPVPAAPTDDGGRRAVLSPDSKSQTLDPKSVAVLAFANLSDDKGNEYFSDGISEELLNVLAKVPQLKVAARTSSFYFKGRNEPIPEIAQKLGVAYVVEGSVRKAGNKVRVTAQLIKAADGFHVWSETYDRDLTDIFAVQDEIAKKILGVVKGSVLGEAELPHATTTNIEAYTLYLQAQGAFAMRGDANLRESIRLFQAALAIDPVYVPALVGMAKALGVLPNYAYLNGAKAREVTEAANKAARRALELDPQYAAAHASIGWAAFQFGWQWSEGIAEVERARDLAPNDSWNWNLLGDCHRLSFDLVQALKDKQRAWELDPLSPNSHWDLSYTYLVAGRYDEAIKWSEKCIALAPHNIDSYMCGLLAAGHAGRLDLMRRMLTATRENVHEGEGMLLLLEAYGAILEKNPDEARRLLATVTPLAESESASPAYLGYCHLLLGEVEQARSWLQKGYDRHDPAMIWCEIIDFDVIAANPQTRPILDQPGLKELYELRQRNIRAGLNKL